MAILVNMMILSVCVFYVDCRDIGRSGVKHRMMHKRSIDDGAKEYIYCYHEFVGLYNDNFATYHGVCNSRNKLKLCKDRVKKAYPSIEKHITKGYQNMDEKVADFWCTYNKTHHGPNPLFLNMADMYRKYYQCPYVADIMLTHEDYSPRINLGMWRARLADAILHYTGAAGLSQWQPRHQYSDPHDPVYKALSARSCDVYKYQTYITDNIMSRYCVVAKNISRELDDVLDTYDRHTQDGLYNWTTSLCSQYEDVLEQVMRISQLDKWLGNQKKPDLSPCHDHNIYIEGATCLIMFHTRLPPYSDPHNVMPTFVKNVAELNSCWDRVISGCPQPSSASRNISLLIEIYNLASDISREDSAQVWDVIWSWSDSYKKTEAQWILQALYQLLIPGAPSRLSIPLAFGRSLATALNHTSALPHITALFSNLSSALDKISVVGNDDYHSVNIFQGFHSMNDDVLTLLFACFKPLYELFVEVAEFVQYKALCPEFWPPPCGA